MKAGKAAANIAVALALMCFCAFPSCGDDDDADDPLPPDDDLNDDYVDDDEDDDTDDDHDNDTDNDSDDDIDDDDIIEPIYGYAVWPSETGPERLAEWHPFFAEKGARLFIEVLEDQILNRDPIIAQIFREAAAAGVYAEPYIILPLEAGVYPNEDNFERFFNDVKAMIQWAEEEDLPIEWIVVDMETPVQMVDRINQYLADFDLLGLYLFLLQHRDPVAFAQSIANYQEMVDYCHDHGFFVHVITFPFVLDDYSDGDFGMQDAFDMPVSGVQWDEVDFMVYRTMYQDYSSMPLTSDMVYQYALMSKEIFGDLASIVVGLVLWPGWFDGDGGYQDPAELEADIEAALAAGLSKVSIFYLTGLLEKEDPMLWMDPDVSDYQIPPTDPLSTLLIDVALPLLDVIL